MRGILRHTRAAARIVGGALAGLLNNALVTRSSPRGADDDRLLPEFLKYPPL